MRLPAPRRRQNIAAPDDATVMKQVAQGNVGELAVLYDRYALRLMSFARRISGAQDAPDVVHTTFLRVVALSGDYDPAMTSARSWLFAIVLRVVREQRRSRQRWTTDLHDPMTHPPVQGVDVAEARDEVERCLERLSVAKRTVLLLAEVQGFTCDEIATMLSIPVGTVWTRLYHARRELRRRTRGTTRASAGRSA